ncbi:MAG: hypothetical protein BRC29_02085 [Nanohaloarchaea archaeon SW_7_43_1]|nr:MAG: hypothetical protein BRC29_02085 [Nanohaloarchaea archaeon SW_7_43_1]
MRKGITPVIAVVLLLLITVGAVASAWGLYQNIISDQSQVDQLNSRQQAQQTDINIESAYENSTSNTITLTYRNVGERTVDLPNETAMRYQPGNEQEPLQRDTLFRINQEWNSSKADGCLKGTDQAEPFNPGAERTCDTGVNFPNATQEIRVVIDYQQIDSEDYSYMCNPQTGSTNTC